MDVAKNTLGSNPRHESRKGQFKKNEKRNTYKGKVNSRQNGNGCKGNNGGKNEGDNNRQRYFKLESKKCDEPNRNCESPQNKMKLDFGDDDCAFTINKSYAKNYDLRRRSEELMKLKARYGDEKDESDCSSTDTEEDEDGNRLPQEFDKEFLRTLSFLKNKDPRIYKDDAKFFENLDVIDIKSLPAKTKKKEKPFSVRDHERELLLANDGLPDEEKANEELKKELLKEGKTYLEEQQQLKESFKKHLVELDDDTDLLTERKKSAEETVKEEEDYYNWLKGQTDHVKENSFMKDVNYLKKYWNKEELDKDEQFLRDYILKKEYLSTNENEDFPCYEEIIKEVDVDEVEFIKQEDFEHKFNFRFEEPDAEFVKRYPRCMPESMRRKDNKRKDKRLEIRERKLKEKDKKKEALKRMKAIKRAEIMEKLEQIKQITGNTIVGVSDFHLEEDFDPEKHDRQMQQMFGDEFYGERVEEEEEKPDYLKDDEEYENWDEWNVETATNFKNEASYSEPHCEDPDFNMDLEYDPKASFQAEMINCSKRKQKKMSKLTNALKRKKPTFNPTEKTFEEYFDEYYQLDYEDMIDDMPCRFKYRKVLPSDFGLTVEEILGADDKELNKWYPLRKSCQYRSKEEEEKDMRIFKKKGMNLARKANILTSFYTKDKDETEQMKEATDMTTSVQLQDNNVKKPKKQQLRKNKSNTAKSLSNDRKADDKTAPNRIFSEGKKHKDRKDEIKNCNEEKKRKRDGKDEGKEGKKQKGEKKKGKKLKQRLFHENAVDVGMEDSRMLAFGINPKEYKKKLKLGLNQ